MMRQKTIITIPAIIAATTSLKLTFKLPSFYAKFASVFLVTLVEIVVRLFDALIAQLWIVRPFSRHFDLLMLQVVHCQAMHIIRHTDKCRPLRHVAVDQLIIRQVHAIWV